MPIKSDPKNILIVGDSYIEKNIARSTGLQSVQWQVDRMSKIWTGPGGVHLLGELLTAIVERLHSTEQPEINIQTQGFPRSQDESQPISQMFAIWDQFPVKGGKAAWRVADYLGMDHSGTGSGETASYQRSANNQPLSPSIIVVEDLNLGFRSQPDSWPQALTAAKGKPWIVLNMAAPVMEGPLWEKLFQRHQHRMLVITSIDNLRLSEVQISRGHSWERTSQDILWELTYNPRVNALSRCAHVVVSLGTAGAIHLSQQQSGSPQGVLLFDPAYMEGEWEKKYPGGMFGCSACLITALTSMLLQDPDKPDLHTGIQAGIAAKRLLLREGYGNPGTSPVEAGLRFPVERIAAEIGSGNAALATAFIQDPVSNLLPPYNSQSKRVMPGFWTILEDRYTDHLSMVAQRIVLEGIVPVLRDVPIGRFGALVTVDRREIEALQSIRTLLIEYCKRPQVRPLSLAVFGPPGSGKSFAVKQIAKSILPGEIQTITFNISQFDEQEDLFDALHQVRDIGLSGKIPLVFWDEFDSDLAGYPLGWLRYFLSPMQDGTFQEGEIIHPIGRSIFIFAGATSHTMKAFGRNLSEEQQRTVKLPDFISRLKGYLNVLGPNPLQGIEDPYFIIRRAILLRSMFERLTPQIIQEVSGIQQVQIDNGLLRALLETRRYRHGVRSIETILSISRLSDAASFERSSLPAEDQLNLHVEADDFLARVHAIQLEDDVLERLACAAHDLFCETLRDQGYKYGDRHNSDKSHPALVPYEQLTEYLKHANRSTVLDIANKLAITGYVMMPARSNEPAFDFPGKDLEILAELEHQRWLQEKETAGWQYAPETRESEKLHSAMMSWDELPEDEKQKDREMVRSIPRILAKAGYAVLKL